MPNFTLDQVDSIGANRDTFLLASEKRSKICISDHLSDWIFKRGQMLTLYLLGLDKKWFAGNKMVVLPKLNFFQFFEK